MRVRIPAENGVIGEDAHTPETCNNCTVLARIAPFAVSQFGMGVLEAI